MTFLCRLVPQLLSFATLAACLASPDPVEEQATVAAEVIAPRAGYRYQILQTQRFTIDARSWNVILARVTRPDGGRTYVQWIPSDKPGPRPLVVSTDPYDGVAWSGEALDARWAAYQPEGNGLYLDRDGPGFDGTTTIAYYRKTPVQVAEEMMPHLFNDFGALVVFGRYYAGGSVRDDVADMAAGMWFAAEQPQVDRTRVGIWGGSWGGFEALFAAQQADARAQPRAVAALYPPSDFADWVEHALTRTGAAKTALMPYVRRIYAATGGPPAQPGTDYRGLRAADLCAALPETLTLHDEHDNLVPVRESQALAATCGVNALYWPRSGPVDPAAVDHGPLIAEASPPSITLYSMVFLHLRLLSPEQPYLLEFYAPSALRDHLRTIYAAQLAGRNIDYVIPRLHELMDPRVYLIDLATCGASGCGVEHGIDVVARTIDEIWGAGAHGGDGASVMAQLGADAVFPAKPAK